ncbi:MULTISPECIES: ester cyclase [unclassified Mycobacterium]|uniref:ester cyclase n=1 Tax=unclassified Mycobacterium TaxID=2642494 RepID=UPI0029C683F6|nr:MULTISPECIES: ester cyclase [unclassified Mycobacterium]
MVAQDVTDNAALVRRWVELTNERQFEELRELWADDLVLHQGDDLEDIRGFDAFAQLLGAFYAGFPDLRIAVEDVIASDDLVLMRSTSRGTHTGEFMGIPPTGRSVEFPGIGTYRIAEGKIVEEWFNDDLHGLMRVIAT